MMIYRPAMGVLVVYDINKNQRRASDFYLLTVWHGFCKIYYVNTLFAKNIKVVYSQSKVEPQRTDYEYSLNKETEL